MESLYAMLSRRNLIRVGVVGAASLAVAPVLAACGQAPASTPPPTATTAGNQAATPAQSAPSSSGVTEISISVWGDVSDLDINNGIIGGFAKKNDKIKVTPNQWVGNYYQKLQVGIAGNTVPDMVYFQGWMWQPYAMRGQITEITDYVNRDKATLPANLFPDIDAYARQLRLHSKYYGMPQDTGAMVIYYNKDLFDLAGVPYPKDDWTFQDFLGICQKLQDGFKKAGKTNVFAYQPNYNSHYVRNFPWWRMHGGMEFETLEDPKKAQWDQPEVVAAWQTELYDLTKKGQAISSSDILSGSGNNTYSYGLQNGLVAMKQEGPWFLPQMWGEKAVTKGGLKFDVVPLPKGSKSHSSFWQVEPMCIMKSKNPDACFEYLKYVVTTEGQQFVAQGGRTTNTPESIINQWAPIAQKAYNFQNGKAFGFAQGASMVLTGGMSSDQFDVNGGLVAARDAIINGTKTAKDALGEANKLVQGVLDDYWKTH